MSPVTDQGADEVEWWFAANLKAARERAGMSQETMAQRMRHAGYASWKQQTVTKVENAARRVLLAEARALARILGLTDAELTQPPETVRDGLALREAVSRLWQARSDAQYAALYVNEARGDLETLLASLREGDHGEALAEQITAAEKALKEESP